MSSSRFCFLAWHGHVAKVWSLRTRETHRGFQGGSLKGRRDDRRKTPCFTLFLPSCCLECGCSDWSGSTYLDTLRMEAKCWEWQKQEERHRLGPRDREATTSACSGLLIHYRENLYAFKPLFLEFY